MEDFIKLVKISKTLVSVLMDDPSFDKITGSINSCFKIITKDEIGKLLLSKLSTNAEKIKAIYLAYFMIKKPNLKWVDYYKMINNLYVLTYYTYEDETTIKINCGACDGTGEENCQECSGEGDIDCKYCDGEGEIECTTCWGEKTQKCGECDGDGEIEGDEDEVETCDNCDGSGEEKCRDCGGRGGYPCDECDGSGKENCKECGGHGDVYCGWCGGSGEDESEELYYDIYRVDVILFGNKMKQYVDHVMPSDEFYDMEYEFKYDKSFRSFYGTSGEPANDLRAENDLDENFINITDLRKLDDTDIKFYHY